MNKDTKYSKESLYIHSNEMKLRLYKQIHVHIKMSHILKEDSFYIKLIKNKIQIKALEYQNKRYIS